MNEKIKAKDMALNMMLIFGLKIIPDFPIFITLPPFNTLNLTQHRMASCAIIYETS